MHNLDKYLADRLDEEGAFPGRDAAWRALAYRLEAAAARRLLVRWQWASGGLLLCLLAVGGLAYRFYGDAQRQAAQLAEIMAACEAALSRTTTPVVVGIPPTALSAERPRRGGSVLQPRSVPAPAEEDAPSPVAPPAGPEVADAPSVEAEMSAAALPSLSRAIEPLVYEPRAPQWPTLEARRRSSRLWIGLQGTAGIPMPRPGISLLQGAGLGLEYRALGQLWLTAAADWLSYDVRHTQYLPAAFYRENPPQAFKIVLGKPPVPYPLHDVVANQRLRLLSAGLRYRPPVRFWLRPSVHVAHTWAYVSPAIYNYTFVDTLPGTPPKILRFSSAQSTAAYSVQGLWRLGVAVERETDQWAIRLGLSRQETFRPNFYDAWLVQGSLWYKW
ncbi:MAG: hypothetical protein RMJ33_13070 [Saprospiraceae bacterium]|nr:hypothetical protein [Saprospiraceae bacterium]MDW8230760.1 hypothetical protein [Saprospiraceae bacterium]